MPEYLMAMSPKEMTEYLTSEFMTCQMTQEGVLQP
jgi:hypothetical protein